MNILLFIHLVLAILLIIVVLLQKTSVDGVSTLSGNNSGLMNIQSANSFLVKTTVIIATLFFANSILLANYSSSLSASNTAQSNVQNTSESLNIDDESQKELQNQVDKKLQGSNKVDLDSSINASDESYDSEANNYAREDTNSTTDSTKKEQKD